MPRPRVITNQLVARNPVARSVALSNLKRMFLAIKLKLYSAVPGQEERALLADSLYLLDIIGRAAIFQWGPEPVERDKLVAVRVIKGATSACVSAIENGSIWDDSLPVAIERGLEEAETINAKIKPEHMYDAVLGKQPRSPS
jgi:hypothetical protein